MNKFLIRALPVCTVVCDVLIIYGLAKEVAADIKNYRKKHQTTDQDEDSETAPEPTTT